MATTGQNFVEVTTTTLSGATVTTQPFLVALGFKEAAEVEQGGKGVCVDRVVFDLSLPGAPPAGTPHQSPTVYGAYCGGYAKNGEVLLTLSGSTAQSIDLTNTAVNTPASSAGDTAFATVNCLILRNLGLVDLVLSPGASNPSNIPKLGGTSPTLTIPAGSCVVIHSLAGVTIDSTHKVFTITPTSGGSLAVGIGGA